MLTDAQKTLPDFLKKKIITSKNKKKKPGMVVQEANKKFMKNG
jgi:hypothetical protein